MTEALVYICITGNNAFGSPVRATVTQPASRNGPDALRISIQTSIHPCVDTVIPASFFNYPVILYSSYIQIMLIHLSQLSLTSHTFSIQPSLYPLSKSISIHMSVQLFIYPSVSYSIYPFIPTTVQLYVHLSIHPDICLSLFSHSFIYASIRVSLYHSIHPFIHHAYANPSVLIQTAIHLYVRPAIHLSLPLYHSIFPFIPLSVQHMLIPLPHPDSKSFICPYSHLSILTSLSFNLSFHPSIGPAYANPSIIIHSSLLSQASHTFFHPTISNKILSSDQGFCLDRQQPKKNIFSFTRVLSYQVRLVVPWLFCFLLYRFD